LVTGLWHISRREVLCQTLTSLNYRIRLIRWNRS